MRLHSKTIGVYSKEWEDFAFGNGKLVLPTGQRLSPSQVLIGAALIEINSEIELKTSRKILKTARALSNLMPKL